VVISAGELWALRYPAAHALHILERPARPPGESEPAAGEAGLHVRSTTSSIHMPELHTAPSVVVASEELDGEDGWRMLAPGELVHIRADLSVQSAVVLDEPPARPVPLSAQNPNIDT
jgi:predicted glutamine amidotransferase